MWDTPLQGHWRQNFRNMSYHVGVVLNIIENQLYVRSTTGEKIIVRIQKNHIGEKKRNAILANLSKYRIIYTESSTRLTTVPPEIQRKKLYEWRLKNNFSKIMKKYGHTAPAIQIEQIQIFNTLIKKNQFKNFSRHYPAYTDISSNYRIIEVLDITTLSVVSICCELNISFLIFF